MRTEHTRSIQTISHSTEVINSFFDKPSQRMFSVRRLSCRVDTKRQLFIVTVENADNSSEFRVIPYAELTVCKDKVRYLVNPAYQYPELEDRLSSINTSIEKTVCDFIQKYSPVVSV
ncbi:hypothetical protein [Photorhabdus luminescens]|uniref:Uncharacterized protein n=1 Tax=Photorhabdus luminescens subsp. mexicana TaxID=2100167 RepID=A0A4R4IU46_PHOLU|nr:hypothetical protein [Photorhabdus luminescens]TDB44102.1 hypothetical protein C5468_23000 [Photorhabdus luminescens subsp. mexicana]